MDSFKGKSVKELQKYLRDRGVVTARYLKAGLLELCRAAEQLGIEIDPDGLIEDRHEIVSSKLRVEGGELEIPPLLSDYSTNIGILPLLSIFDIYNYLISFTDYTHGTFRDVTKMEAYSMAKDGYVRTVMAAPYASHDGYYAILSKVKPRTQEKDPISKLDHYPVWIIMWDNEDRRIKSALCHCKGGYVWYHAWIPHIKYFLHCYVCIYLIIYMATWYKTKHVSGNKYLYWI